LFDADRVCFHKALIMLNSNIVSHRSENEEKGKMKNKTTVLTSIALMLLILASSIYIMPAKAVVVPNPETYISETIGEPMTQDPGTCYDTASIELLMNIYDPLLFWDFASTGSFIPMIAESWWGNVINEYDPISGLTYNQTWTFKIRQGVHFQRGASVPVPGEYHEVTVADVEYSFERNMVLDSAVGGELLIWDPLLHIGSADLADPAFGAKIDRAVRSNPVARTVTFYLLTPFEPFLQVVAQTYGAIMCKQWLTDTTLFHDDPLTLDIREDNWPGTWGDYSAAYWEPWHDPAVTPIEAKDPASGEAPHPHLDCALGTGPYMLDYWNKGDHGEYKLIKNPDYWRGWASPGHVDTFIQRNIVEWDLRKADFLAGTADIVVVPRAYMDQVLGCSGIRCLKDLEDLGVTSEFFGQDISPASQFIGNPPANGTFASDGFPCNGFTDEKLRKAFRALFPFDAFLEAAYQNEAVQPASCVAKGLAYYDPAIAKPQYNRALAIKLLKEAWGGSEASPGPVWTNGFTMGFVYNSGNVARQKAAEMLRDQFAALGTEYFGDQYHFHGIVTGQPWSGSAYRLQWQTHQLPFYSVGWGADFPDAHNYVVPFMDGKDGAFAKFQGFSNATINQWIRNGIDTIVPSERQYWYTLLQQAYNDNCYSFMLSQATMRRFERDWVQGWFYHPVITTEEYVYDRWKADPATVTRDVRVVHCTIEGSGSLVYKQCIVHNNGETPELVKIHCVAYYMNNPANPADDVIYEDDWVDAWLKPCVPWSCCLKAIPIAALRADLCINCTVQITQNWQPLITDWNLTNNNDKHCIVGDLGGGVPPAFFKLDERVDGKDLALLLLCFKGLAHPNPLLCDLGGAATFFNFDGLCNGNDVALFLLCFKGLGPDP
jgi:peptide/nickel transport system substrate-binding protein